MLKNLIVFISLPYVPKRFFLYSLKSSTFSRLLLKFFLIIFRFMLNSIHHVKYSGEIVFIFLSNLYSFDLFLLPYCTE